jgi:hypothetical protein
VIIMVSLKERVEKMNKEIKEKAHKQREREKEKGSRGKGFHEMIPKAGVVTVLTDDGRELRTPLHRTRDGFLVDEEEGTPIK